MAWPSIWPDLGRISDRDQKILYLAACGRTNKAIAHEMGVSAGAVQQALYKLSTRARVSGRVSLVIVALKLGWLKLDELEINRFD